MTAVDVLRDTVDGFSVSVEKLNAMGLLPTHASDWLSGLKPPVFYERAYGGTEM